MLLYQHRKALITQFTYTFRYRKTIVKRSECSSAHHRRINLQTGSRRCIKFHIVTWHYHLLCFFIFLKTSPWLNITSLEMQTFVAPFRCLGAVASLIRRVRLSDIQCGHSRACFTKHVESSLFPFRNEIAKFSATVPLRGKFLFATSDRFSRVFERGH